MERFKILGDEYSQSLSWAEKRKAADEIFSEFALAQPNAILKTFIVLTGIPGSGKSIISQFLNQKYGFNAVSSDKIKLYLQENNKRFTKPDLFHIQAMIFRYLFKMDLNVVSDSNSGLSKHRYKLKSMAERYNYDVININLAYDPEVCFQRVIARNAISDPEILEKWKLKIYAFDAEIQTPRNAITIDSTKNFDEVQFDLVKALELNSKLLKG